MIETHRSPQTGQLLVRKPVMALVLEWGPEEKGVRGAVISLFESLQECALLSDKQAEAAGYTRRRACPTNAPDKS